MMVVVMVVLVGSGFFLNSPTEVEEIVDGTRKLERTIGVVPINLVSLVQKMLEKRVVKVGDWDHESLRGRPTFFIFVL